MGLGLNRAHLDEQFAIDIAGEQSCLAAIDRVDGGGIGENGDDCFRPLRERHWALCDSRAGIRERSQFFRAAVPGRHFMAGFHEPLRDGTTHLSCSGDPDPHLSALPAQGGP